MWKIVIVNFLAFLLVTTQLWSFEKRKGKKNVRKLVFLSILLLLSAFLTSYYSIQDLKEAEEQKNNDKIEYTNIINRLIEENNNSEIIKEKNDATYRDLNNLRKKFRKDVDSIVAGLGSIGFNVKKSLYKLPENWEISLTLEYKSLYHSSIINTALFKHTLFPEYNYVHISESQEDTLLNEVYSDINNLYLRLEFDTIGILLSKGYIDLVLSHLSNSEFSLDYRLSDSTFLITLKKAKMDVEFYSNIESVLDLNNSSLNIYFNYTNTEYVPRRFRFKSEFRKPHYCYRFNLKRFQLKGGPNMISNYVDVKFVESKFRIRDFIWNH